MKTEYELQYDSFEMHVKIDNEVMTEKELHDINNFWSNSDYRLSSAGIKITRIIGFEIDDFDIDYKSIDTGQ